jgi:hypothetical protein
LAIEWRMHDYDPTLRMTILAIIAVVILSAIGLNIALFVKTYPI